MRAFRIEAKTSCRESRQNQSLKITRERKARFKANRREQRASEESQASAVQFRHNLSLHSLAEDTYMEPPAL
jgi:hypothetical protein